MEKIIAALMGAFLLFCVSCNDSKDYRKVVIASKSGDCIGEGTKDCLLVKRPGTKQWEYLYMGIEGFDYTPGYEYLVKLKKEKIAQPHLGEYSFKYVLDKVLLITEKESQNLPQDSYTMLWDFAM